MLKNKFTSFFPDKPKAALLKAKEIFERYQKSVAKKIVNIVLTATAVFLAVTLVFVLYAKITNKSILSRRILWVMTSSMETTIPARSYILARDIDPADVRVGDVIAFYSSDPTLAGQLNTHRVVEIIGDHEAFRTKGDANPLEDKYSVKPEDVLARYERNMPFLSILGRVYSSLLGFILILLFVMSRTVVWCIQTLKKAESEERDDEIERRIAEEIKKLESGDIQALISTGEYALVRVSSQKQDDESEPEAETPIPAEEPAAEEPLPMEEPVEEEPVPAEEPVTEEPLPMEEPVEEEPVPVKEPATEELLPVEEPAEEEPLPVEEPVEEEPAPAEEPVEEEPVSVEESPLEEIDLLADATENGRSDGGSLAESELSWRGHLLDPKFARAVQRMDAETFRAYQDKITSAIERDLAESTEAAKQSEDMEKLVRRLANQVLRIKENNRVRRENGWAVLDEESIPQLVEKAEILSDKRRSALQKKTEAEQRMIRNTRLLEAVNMIRQNEDAESLPGGADLAKGRSLTDSAEGDDRNETRFKE